MRRHAILVAMGSWLLLSVEAASAQNLTVQQPVFNNFSVGTTVSVPDRGSAYIGGVSRAGSGRKSYGPLRSGSSFGLFRESSSVSTHVWIHDLREMDRMILGQAGSSWRGGDATRLSGGSAHAYSSLLERHASQSASRDAAQQSAADFAAAKASRSLRLGEAAAAKGKLAVAKLHFRMAARYGSAEAREKLAAWDDRSTIATAGGAK